jgi:NAD(P)H dehydrogenase (quinone)
VAKVLVLYYSAYGHIETMANAVAEGARQPTANELQGARYQGRKIAEVATKLHG